MIRDAFESAGAVGCAIVLTIALVLGGTLGYLWYQSTFGVAKANVEFQVQKHQGPYVLAHQQELVRLYSDVLTAPDDAHRKGAVLLVCEETAFLDATEYPTQVAPFIARNCR